MIHVVIGVSFVAGLLYIAAKKHLTLASVKAEVLKIEASPAVSDGKAVIAAIKTKLGL